MSNLILNVYLNLRHHHKIQNPATKCIDYNEFNIFIRNNITKNNTVNKKRQKKIINVVLENK